MKVEVQKSFEKDIEKITDKKFAIAIETIIEALENCKALSEIHNLKKMKAKGSYYRIRIGSYRLGMKQDYRLWTMDYLTSVRYPFLRFCLPPSSRK